MLQWLRKYSRSWFIAAAIGAIAVVFIFWGIGSFSSPRFQEVATVNGTPILLPAYIREYNELLRQYRERVSGEFSEDTIKALHLKEQALNRLIDQVLLLQAAQRLGLKVSTAELQAQIRRYPIFQEEGQFSERRYFLVLSRMHLSPGDFEAQERQRLLVQKLIQETTAFAKVSEAEVEEAFRLSREAVQVQYLVVSPEQFQARQQVSQAEMAAYWREHSEEFRQPARAKVSYVLFRPQDFLEQARPSPKELEDYLQEHADEFLKPQVIRVRQLVLPLAPQASRAEKNRVEKQARELLAQARGGQDFEQLVQQHAKGPVSQKLSGDLGYVKRGQNLPAWEKVAFSLRAGEVGLAQTPQGFHLIQVEEVKETEKIPDAEAREQASRTLTQEKSRRLAEEKAHQARGEMVGGSWPEVARKYGLTPKETPLIAQTEAVPDLGRQPAFNRAALALKPREVSKVVALAPGFAVLQGLEHQAAFLPPLEQVQDKVRQAVAKKKAKEQAAQEAEKLAQRLGQGESLAQVAARAGLPLRESDFFSRFQGFQGQAAGPLTSAAFQLSKERPHPNKPLLWQDNYYLLAFKARRVPSPEEFQKERDRLKSQLLEFKQQLLFEAWLNAERQRAKIKIYELPS